MTISSYFEEDTFPSLSSDSFGPTVKSNTLEEKENRFAIPDTKVCIYYAAEWAWRRYIGALDWSFYGVSKKSDTEHYNALQEILQIKSLDQGTGYKIQAL